MPKFRCDVQPLLERSIDSLTLGIELFNRPTDTARAHGVPMLPRQRAGRSAERLDVRSHARMTASFAVESKARERRAAFFADLTDWP
ncbi:hypothetical protein [Myxococcus qinghaiensis]|uniref:hypothetical protein n=1 Tax=Myxococcus qinghaiensis TaxID=2906758 RepID=UPI0020A7C5FC|nr:hypothetical protein [Myxococcus qinghaiensis]MCP3164549.1 hypothetical protein [Myxococcus qinghaiensis]